MSSKIESFYVIVNPNQVDSLFMYVASVARQKHMSANIGRATDDRGNTLRVLESKNWRMKMWLQNVPLSGHENQELCGAYSEPHPDPGQYVLTITPTVPLFGAGGAADLRTQLMTELKVKKFVVESEPRVCSSLSKTT